MLFFNRTKTVVIKTFLEEIRLWAKGKPEVIGVALVGSYARGTARPDSDIDLVILINSFDKKFDSDWLPKKTFGEIKSHKIENYGNLKSFRVFYENGREVEFGITGTDWAKVPLDIGTRTVLEGGFRPLYDPTGILGIAEKAARLKPVKIREI